MKNVFIHITKGSKLIVIYILTVLISGSILTFLSINNISNFEELTEKRIREEEKLIVENYRDQFQVSLENLVSSLEKIAYNDPLNIKHRAFILENELIDDYLTMDKNGVLLRPLFIQSSTGKTFNNSSPYFLQKFKLAESAEFIHKDYIKSENAYLKSLRFAKSTSDSAKAFNALARVYIKKGDQKRAFILYKQMITDFNQTLNDFGFSYAYFSIDQLFKLTDTNLKKDKEEVVVNFLNGLLNNSIPYNNSTSDLVKKISTEAEQIDDATTQHQVKVLCDIINQKITSILDYKETMETVVVNSTMDTLMQLKNFLVINNENSSNEVMLMQKFSEISIGYILQLNKIDSIVSKKIPYSEGKFDYTIQLTDAGSNKRFYDKEMAVKNNFSPFFNKKIIEVHLKEPAMVQQYIFNRKITTAAGLFLLLAAMLIGLFTLTQDVNRKKRMAKMRSNFISNVTHELKTPLTSINMFADSIVLDRVTKKKDIKKYANIIVKESEKLKRMINNILDFSRSESNKLTYHLKECNLAEVLHDIMNEMNYWLEINKFEVHLTIDEKIMAVADPEGLKQVLSNLITNAIKYSESIKKIEIRLYKKKGKAYIEVEDHGIGIAEDQLRNIFEKFYRVNSKKNENISGTGLGLTVSKDIIESQNGKLLVNSTLNKGSKFTIVLNI